MPVLELLRENEWTVDGRFIEAGSVSWEEIVPLYSNVAGEDMLVGTVTDLFRSENRIYGYVDLDVACVTVGGSMTKFQTCDEGAILSEYHVLYGMVSDPLTYPWKDEAYE